MLSLRDCLDYCDLTHDEVEVLAEQEGLPHIIAAELACALVQTDEGLRMIHRVFRNALAHAQRSGDEAKLGMVREVVQRFERNHPIAPRISRAVAGPVH